MNPRHSTALASRWKHGWTGRRGIFRYHFPYLPIADRRRRERVVQLMPVTDDAAHGSSRVGARMVECNRGRQFWLYLRHVLRTHGCERTLRLEADARRHERGRPRARITASPPNLSFIRR
jgi:hypothetical protein